MKNAHLCPKCNSGDIARVPDTTHRYLANSICVTKFAWVKRIPVARYVCCQCGYVENWVEKSEELNEIRRAFG